MKKLANPSNEKVRRYLKMIPKDFKASFPELKRVLKEGFREDVSIYLIRMFRLFKIADHWPMFQKMAVKSFKEKYPALHKDIVNIFGTPEGSEDRAYRDFESYMKFAKFDFKTFLTPFEHYLQTARLNDIAKILDYRLGYQHPSRIFNEWASFEYEALKSSEGRKVKKEMLSWGEVVLNFHDGTQWVLLNQTYCEKEGKAAGHCGNANFIEGDRVLSLRQKDKGERWIVRATLVVHYLSNNNWGILVESKGYGNSKIAKKYHPYLEDLFLKTKIIRLNFPSRYKTDVDFSFRDMDEEMRKRILNRKPWLNSLSAFNKKFGEEETLDVIWSVGHGISLSGMDSEKFYFDKDDLVLAEYKDINNFAERVMPKEFQWLVQHSPDDWDERPITTKDDVKSAIEIIRDNKPKFYKKIVKVCEKFGFNDYSLCVENNFYSFYELIVQSVGDAWQSGSYSAWENTINNILKVEDGSPFISGAFVEINNFHDKIYLKIDLDDFFLWLRHGKSYDDITDLETPLRPREVEYEGEFDFDYFEQSLLDGLTKEMMVPNE